MTTASTVILAACGDIMLHNRYQALADENRAAEVFAELRDIARGVDLLVGNLETPLTRGGFPRDDKLCLRGDPKYARVLANAGLAVASLANNHSLDYGAEALAETRGLLKAAGIGVTGAGATLADASDPVIIERNGIRLGFLGACDASTKPAPSATAERAGVLPLAAEPLLDTVGELRAQVDHVILMLHWGLEYSLMPTPDQVRFARLACERGVSVVLGHHSHCIQGIEHYKGAIIAYSLANLTDDAVDWQGPARHYAAPLTEADRESLLLRLELDKSSVQLLQPVPLWLDDAGRPTAAKGERADKILNQAQRLSEQLRTTKDLQSYWEDTIIERRVAGPLLSWWNDGSLWDKLRRFRPGQMISAWLLLRTYLRIKFSRSQSRWMLFSERNDTRPMPAVRNKPVDD
jgi:hypothetical protein